MATPKLITKETQQAIKAAIKDLKAQAKAKKQEIDAWAKTAKKGQKGLALQQINKQQQLLKKDVDLWLKDATLAVNQAAYGVTAIPTGVMPLTDAPTAITGELMNLLTGGGYATESYVQPSMMTMQQTMPAFTAQSLTRQTTLPLMSVGPQAGVPANFQVINTPYGPQMMPMVMPGGQYPAAPAGYTYTQTQYGPALVPGAQAAPSPMMMPYQPPVSSTAQAYYAPQAYAPPAPQYFPGPEPSYAPPPSYTSTYQPQDTFTMPYAPASDVYQSDLYYPSAQVYPPSSATMVMTSPGGQQQVAPEVAEAYYSQEAAQYQMDDWGNLWPGSFTGYGAQVLTPYYRPARQITRNLTAIQRVNSLPVLMESYEGFGQSPLSPLLSAAIQGASTIGSAAIQARLAPRVQQYQPAPQPIVQRAPVVPQPQQPGYSMTTPLVIAGAAAVGLLVLIVAMKK